jgi:hypothetical protein
MRWMNGKLYTGGKDGNFVITDTVSKTVEKTIQFGSLIRAIDIYADNAVLGLRNGSIVTLNLSSGQT